MQIFKILTTEAWRAAMKAGVYRGSPDDARDGFIHLSTSAQLAGTLARHFSDASDLMLVALDSDALGKMLKWEPGHDGQSFPHLYGKMDLKRVLWTSPIVLKSPGVFALPPQAFIGQPRPPTRMS